jgi:outer membrane protein OmpA-like peptidoglycan-associated protein
MPEPAAVTPVVEAAPAAAKQESENKKVERKKTEKKEAEKGETEPQFASAEKEDSAIGKPAAAPALPVAEKPVAVSEKATAEKSTAAPEQPSAEKPAIAPEKPIAAEPLAATPSAIQHVGTLRFPYDQYPTLLSPQDKRSLDAVASRLKLEPRSTVVIVGSAQRGSSPKTAAQRAVNSKDYLVKKGIAADRVKVFARQAEPARTKSSPMKSELVFVPAGTAYDAAADPVDEEHVRPEHLHVAHPEWHEK